jgi:hypothetical protein
MSTLSPDDHLSPHNPLYYAPRRLRERTERPSTSFAETKIERLKRLGSTSTPSSSSYDALLEGAVADALRHPLEPEVIREPAGFENDPDRRGGLLRVAGRFAAAIGVAAVAAFFFAIMIPASEDHARQPDGAGSSIAGILDSVKTAFNPPRQKDDDAKPAASEFQKILASSRTEQPVVTHEQSETLLQQFLQWQQKPAQTP